MPEVLGGKQMTIQREKEESMKKMIALISCFAKKHKVL